MKPIELSMMRNGWKLVPYGSVAEDLFEKIPTSEPIMVKIHQPRNPDHHNKLFAILGKVAEFDPTFDSAYGVLVWLKLKIPEMHEVYRFEGERLVIVPKSIEFASMDQVAFSDFYQTAMKLLAERLGRDPEEL